MMIAETLEKMECATGIPPGFDGRILDTFIQWVTNLNRSAFALGQGGRHLHFRVSIRT